MSKREMLTEEIRRLCTDIAVDFDDVYEEVSDLIGPDEVVDYYITKGPSPDFPKTLGDVFILGDRCIYDYELREQGSLRHIVPLSMIRVIREGFTHKGGDEAFLSITFNYGGFAGIVMQDKVSNRKKLRGFVNSVRDRFIDKQKER